MIKSKKSKKKGRISDGEIVSMKKFISLGESVVKIYIKNEFVGTGFLLKYKYEEETMKCLITTSQVIDSELIESYGTFEIENEQKTVKKTINLKDGRGVLSFQDNDVDVILIDILPSDKISKNLFLTIEQNYINEMKKNKKNSVYILQFPHDDELYFSGGKIIEVDTENGYDFAYNASSKSGSSGSPIISASSLEVIGIHKEGDEYEPINYGIFIEHIINKVKKQFIKDRKNIEKQRIEITVNINEDDIKKDIAFLGSSGEKENASFDELKYSTMYLDGRKLPYSNKNKFNKIGEHEIVYEFDYDLNTCEYMFCGCNNIVKIKFVNFHTSKITNMGYMFCCCSELVSLDLSSFNTSNVTNTSFMFAACLKLTYLDISSFNTSNVTQLEGMFALCEPLKKIIFGKNCDERIKNKFMEKI